MLIFILAQHTFKKIGAPLPILPIAFQRGATNLRQRKEGERKEGGERKKEGKGREKDRKHTISPKNEQNRKYTVKNRCNLKMPISESILAAGS